MKFLYALLLKQKRKCCSSSNKVTKAVLRLYFTNSNSAVFIVCNYSRLLGLVILYKCRNMAIRHNHLWKTRFGRHSRTHAAWKLLTLAMKQFVKALMKMATYRLIKQIRKTRSKKADYWHVYLTSTTFKNWGFHVKLYPFYCQWSASRSSMFRQYSFCHIHVGCFRHTVPSVAEPFPVWFRWINS